MESMIDLELRHIRSILEKNTLSNYLHKPVRIMIDDYLYDYLEANMGFIKFITSFDHIVGLDFKYVIIDFDIDSILNNLSTLVRLTFDINCKIKKFPKHLDRLQSLQSLHIDCIIDDELPENIVSLSNLTHLTIHTGISSIPENIDRLSKLTFLQLCSNKLTSLPDSIGNLSRLTYLTLMFNTLTSLPESIGNLSQLTTLYLSNNKLTSLPESIGNLSQLTTLSLSNNKLTSLPESIGNLSRLTDLCFSYNQIDSLPKSFGNLLNLTILQLNHNKLTSLPESIGNFTKLIELDICYNQLTFFPTSFGNLTNLIKLYINSNRFTYLPKSICNFNKLSVFVIYENPIKSVDPCINRILENRINEDESFTNELNTRLHNMLPNVKNDKFVINSIPTSFVSYKNLHVIPLNNTAKTLDSIMTVDVVNNITPFDKASLKAYSLMGDYYINNFLWSDMFSRMNEYANTNNYDNINNYDYNFFLINKLSNIPFFNLIAAHFPPTEELNANGQFRNKESLIYYRQKIIYYAMVALYNSIVHICRMIQDKIPLTYLVTYRGSNTHYLKGGSNQFFYFNSFVSTSLQQSLAFSFIKNPAEGCLYQFFIHPSCYYCYMGNRLSNYPEEEELLLSPYHRYYFMGDAQTNFVKLYKYCVLPSDLTIPSRFEDFLPWKNSIVDLSGHTEEHVIHGGRTALRHTSTPHPTRKNKNLNSKLSSKLTLQVNSKPNSKLNKSIRHRKPFITKRSTRKNALMHTPRNTRKNTLPQSIYPSKKDAEERARYWTQPIASFPGKAPTRSEMVMIQHLKDYLTTY